MGIEVLFLLILLVFETTFFLLAVFILVSGFISSIKGASYVPLPKKPIKRILEFAEINDSADFYDLGCGDGRVLIEAVRTFGIRSAVGYEISPWPYLKAKFLVRRLGFEDKIKILRQDFFKADLKGLRTIPFSVMMAWMYRLGVTSKAGFRTLAPCGAMRRPQK